MRWHNFHFKRILITGFGHYTLVYYRNKCFSFSASFLFNFFLLYTSKSSFLGLYLSSFFYSFLKLYFFLYLLMSQKMEERYLFPLFFYFLFSVKVTIVIFLPYIAISFLTLSLIIANFTNNDVSIIVAPKVL